VGEVVATGFEDNSASVRIHAVIDNRYAPLVREDSVIWNASGHPRSRGNTRRDKTYGTGK